MLFLAQEPLEAKSFQIPINEAHRRACKRRMKTLDNRLIATIDQAGKKWLVYRASPDYEPPRRQTHLDKGSGRANLQGSKPSSSTADTPRKRRPRRPRRKRFNYGADQPGTKPSLVLPQDRSIDPKDSEGVSFSHITLKSLGRIYPKRLWNREWDPFRQAKHYNGPLFDHDKSHFDYLDDVINQFRKYHKISHEFAFLPGGWAEAADEIGGYWNILDKCRHCPAQHEALQEQSKYFHNRLRRSAGLTKPFITSDPDHVPKLPRMKIICYKAEVVYRRLLLALLISYESHDLRAVSEVGYEDGDRDFVELSFSLRKNRGINTKRKWPRISPSVVKLPAQYHYIEPGMANKLADRWTAIEGEVRRGIWDKWLAHDEMYSKTADISVLEKLERASGISLGISWPTL